MASESSLVLFVAVRTAVTELWPRPHLRVKAGLPSFCQALDTLGIGYLTTCDFRPLTGDGVQERWSLGCAGDEPALLHMLGLQSPDGLAEPISRAIPPIGTPQLARFRSGIYRVLRTSRRRPGHGSG